MKYISTIMLVITLVLQVASAAFAVANVDFTKPVEEHSMLLLLFLGIAFAISAGAIKILWDKMSKQIEEAKAESREKEERLRNSEYAALKVQYKIASDKLGQLEGACNTCQRTLPFTYVSKMDFEKFAEGHREDITNIGKRVETVIRDLKCEIRLDMEAQIERIVAVLEAKLK